MPLLTVGLSTNTLMGEFYAKLFINVLRQKYIQHAILQNVKCLLYPSPSDNINDSFYEKITFFYHTYVIGILKEKIQKETDYK